VHTASERCIVDVHQPGIPLSHTGEIPMSHNNLTFLALLPALLCATAAFGQGASKSAHADIVNAQGQKIGNAKILATKEGIKIEVNVSQLPPGSHGIHIPRWENVKGRTSRPLARI
jgi:Cu/Zn superoxide dismutase